MNTTTDMPPTPIGLADLIAWVRKYWLPVFAPVVACFILGVLYLFLATPRYVVEALLAPAEQPSAGQSINRLASQLGATSLLGLQGQETQNLSDIAVATLKSRRFVGEFIERHELLPVLFESRWDEDRQGWVDDGESTPTVNDGHRMFVDSLLSVREDEVTGFITVSLEWTDAPQANAWLSALLSELNEDIRQRERDEATKSLEFLRAELERTELNELRQGIYELSLAELQRLTLANVREEFALEVIDPPSLPDDDDPTYPKKLLVLVGSLMFGLVLGLALALFATAWRMSGTRPTDS